MKCKHCGQDMRRVSKARNKDLYGYWFCYGRDDYNEKRFRHYYHVVPIQLIGFDDLAYWIDPYDK